ncbi:hypothetical protein V9T40_002745 [Parthenolecanium corni]|uniref:Tetratricopeptide repeat protein n=1 Tax=Parthenolecanium corni TaxID=536013 RepID=A0AAN9TV17_9HEMI
MDSIPPVTSTFDPPRTVLRNNDWLNEENLYKSSIAINPPKAYGNLGSVLSDAGRLAEAEAAFRTALKYRFNMADVHYNLAMLLENTRRPNEAIISYNLAIKFRPTLAVAYLKLGQLLLTMNREEEAKQLLHNCSKLDGNGLKDVKVHEIAKIEAMIKLASIESKNGYHQNALSIYMQAIVSAPAYYKPQELYNSIGKTLIKMEKYEEAEKWFRYVIGETEFERRELLDLNSFVNNSKIEKQEWLKILKRSQKFNDPFIYLQYGQLLFDMKKYKESAEILKKVLTKMPNDIELLKNTANICRIAGLLSDAKKYYKEIVHLQPDATSYNALGTILYLRGEYNESKLAYQSSLKLNPDNVAVRQNLQKLKCILYNRNNSSNLDKTME